MYCWLWDRNPLLHSKQIRKVSLLRAPNGIEQCFLEILMSESQHHWFWTRASINFISGVLCSIFDVRLCDPSTSPVLCRRVEHFWRQGWEKVESKRIFGTWKYINCWQISEKQWQMCHHKRPNIYYVLIPFEYRRGSEGQFSSASLVNP